VRRKAFKKFLEESCGLIGINTIPCNPKHDLSMEKLVDFVKNEPLIADSNLHMQIAMRFDIAIEALATKPKGGTDLEAAHTDGWRRGMVDGLMYAMDGFIMPAFDQGWIMLRGRADEIYSLV
jgi:hypothetical protein